MREKSLLAIIGRMCDEFFETQRQVKKVDKNLDRVEALLERLGSMERLTAMLDEFDKQCWLLKEYLTCDEAAMYVGLPVSQIRKLIADQEIAYYHPGKRYYIRKVDLLAWVEQTRFMSYEEMKQNAVKISEEIDRKIRAKSLEDAIKRGRKRSAEVNARRGKK